MDDVFIIQLLQNGDFQKLMTEYIKDDRGMDRLALAILLATKGNYPIINELMEAAKTQTHTQNFPIVDDLFYQAMVETVGRYKVTLR